MVYDPAFWNSQTTLSLANTLRETLIKFLRIEGSGAAFWEGEVLPIIKEMCKRGIATSMEEAVFLTGEFVMEKGVICAADMTTQAILQRAACGTTKIASSTMACASIAGIVLLLTAPAFAESDPDNQTGYKKYVNKYLNYLIRAAKLGGHQLRNMPPPMNYAQYMKKLQTTDWIGNNIESTWWQY